MTTTAKRVFRRIGPDTLKSVWRLLGVFLGPRRRLVLLQPMLGASMAVGETMVLLAIVRLLLLLVEGGEHTSVTAVGIDLRFTFGQLVGVAMASAGVSLVLRLVEARVTAAIASHAVASARRAAIETWFGADWERLRASRLGRLQQLIGVNAQQAAGPVYLVASGSVAVISLILYTTIVLATAPLVALLFAVVATVTAAALTPLRRRAKRLARAYADSVGDIQLSATSYASLNRELHVYGVSDEACEALQAQNRHVSDVLRRLRTVQREIPGLYQQLMLGLVVGLVALGRSLDVEASSFGTAAILAIRSLAYAQQLNVVAQSFLESRPYLEDLASNIREQRRLRTPRGSNELGPVETIELRDVRYAYGDDADALEDVELELRRGEWLGIVGASGSGKTTLANILAGLLTPTAGTHRVNGQEPRSFDARSWARQFALVSQEPTLLRASIEDNIAFHRPVKAGELRRAAQLAAIEADIDALPLGFSTPVGEGFSSLSGGQRQRVALARALVARPSCLILDEATSALDDTNERLVLESLQSIPDDTIVVVVSHRPALLQRCDRYLVLERGRITAEGMAPFEAERLAHIAEEATPPR